MVIECDPSWLSHTSILRLDRMGHKFIYGAMWLKKEQRFVRRGVWERPVAACVYEVIEVQPGSDWDWRSDAEFLKVVRKLKN